LNDSTPDPPAPSPEPPPSSGGAGAAIAFAKAQLGEPYVYGADGPDSWDCSGLTSQAWAAAGHPLSHWSVAQYAETTPITSSQLQPGDLVFWSDGSPSSIYHVAMYLGDGMIIQAPRPGRDVEIVSMYYWITPDLFGRVA
jgi:cell wall-associated NlpC family hydrolase